MKSSIENTPEDGEQQKSVELSIKSTEDLDYTDYLIDQQSEPKNQVDQESTDSRIFNAEATDIAKKTEMIRGVNSIEELFDNLIELGDQIPQGDKIISIKEVEDIITGVCKKKLSLKLVPWAYGLRDTVAKLLGIEDYEIPEEPSPKGPKKPPPLEAAVALDLPLDETHLRSGESESIEPVDTPPRGSPPNLNASVSLEIPGLENSVDIAENIPESNPPSPVSPLTNEEGLELQNLTSVLTTQPWMLQDGELEKAYSRRDVLKAKEAAYAALVKPDSFESLEEHLHDSYLQIGDKEFSGSALWDDVQQVRTGEKEISDLPEALRSGVERLLADEVYADLASNIGNTIHIPEFRWKIFLDKHPTEELWLGLRQVGFPRIGEENIRIKDAEVSGTLVWGSPDYFIVGNEGGFQVYSTDELIITVGVQGETITFGEYRRNQGETRRNMSKPRQREL